MVRSLNSVGDDIGNLDALRLELSTETGPMERGTCKTIRGRLLD